MLNKKELSMVAVAIIFLLIVTDTPRKKETIIIDSPIKAEAIEVIKEDGKVKVKAIITDEAYASQSPDTVIAWANDDSFVKKEGFPKITVKKVEKYIGEKKDKEWYIIGN